MNIHSMGVRVIYNFLTFIKPRTHWFFAILASVFGLMIVIITPPFQSPDEINHFFRAYQISEGHFIAVKQDYRVGGYVPVSLMRTTEPFLGLRWDMHSKTSYTSIKKQFKIPLDEEKKMFADFPNTGMYSPVSYLPQSIAIFILKKFKLPPLFIFYGARVFTLFVWIWGIFIALKTIPFFKWFFALTALLPMSVFINMSISADVTTNILSFLLIACILKFACSDQPFTVGNFITICLLVILLASAKVVYTPVVLLFLLIPVNKFNSKRKYYLQLTTIAMLSAGTVICWSTIMNSLYLPYQSYNAQFRDNVTLIKCANMHDQIQYIVNHGLYIWHVFTNSMTKTFDMYFQGYIGVFGWLDTKLPIWFIYLSYIILFVAALADKEKSIRLNLHQKTVIFLSLFITLGLILLSQHLTWDCVGDNVIGTIQGRYFIPVFPLFFLLFCNSRFNNSTVVALLVVVFSVASLSFATTTLYKRYYVTLNVKSIIIRCNAEQISQTNSFATDIPNIFFGNANIQSDEKARSGKFSAKLTSKDQFGFTYRLYHCKLGDLIKADVWRYGSSGGIIISGGKNEFYVNHSIVIEKDGLGWEHLELSFTVPKDMNNEETGIYIYNDSKNSTYFDDMVITYTEQSE